MTPPAPVPPALDGLHVLALPAGTDVVGLARAWFADARWEREPGLAQPAARPTGARFRGIAVEAAPVVGALAVAPGVVLVGPHPCDAATARALGLPARDADLYGLPVRTPAEAQVPAGLLAGWATAAARRTGGGILPADRASVVVPDPAAALDLTLWSAVPVAAQDVVPLVRPALSGSRLGPASVPADGAPGFTLTATFPYDGAVVVRLARAAQVPLVLSGLDWREHGPWGYHVTWEPPDPLQLQAEPPSQQHVVARTRVAPAVARVVGTLWRAAGGTVVDAGGFVVGRAELDERAGAALR
ncbi:hypothetical protein GC089_17310 [Cellulomonas sp. JZ18]|uniref:hypothetical protein n=1 Tax=Cellulomonas sp. JZ18 TaxID=2654191 RepID=UPI0012D3FCB5|nr:hypothetical protein [Cellulomonas sp. JZ18]QGQ20625.1 hypothetical protein GC089_17310 [Cellulomonas sp. JZ18]